MEIGIQGKNSDFLFGGWQNTAKMLELLISGGTCLLTGKKINDFNFDKGLSQYDDFESFYNDSLKVVKKYVHLKVARDEEVFETDITPMISNDGYYRIGIWVRDSTAGIGTLTFYNPEDNSFAALGHAITDCDTGTVLTVSCGDLVGCEILSVKKGEHGTPGELSGQFENKNLGKILKNNDFGIYGKIKNSNVLQAKPMRVATRFQIKQGPATILCDVDGNGVKSYDIEITKVSTSSKVDNKGIVLKITDNDLLSKTGGIVQGMSGSPIIQNDMIVGAVTHVFVNDPTRGYGIFIENMLNET
jgi:stage IV sporulation protein B